MLSLRMNEIVKQKNLLDFYSHNVSAGIDCCKKKKWWYTVDTSQWNVSSSSSTHRPRFTIHKQTNVIVN